MFLLGYIVCLDGFLYNFTILPLRIAISIAAVLQGLVMRQATGTLGQAQRRPPRKGLPFFGADLFLGAIFVVVSLLLQGVDSSRLYHVIRGQSAFKLYVIFNVFEASLGSAGTHAFCAYGPADLPAAGAPVDLGQVVRLLWA